MDKWERHSRWKESHVEGLGGKRGNEALGESSLLLPPCK